MNKRVNYIILAISSLSFIALVISISLLLGEHFQVESCACPKMVSQNFIALFIILSIIFVGGLIYYLLSLQIEKKEKKVKFNIETVKKFLDKDENLVLNQLDKNNGEIFQSRLKGNKVRVSRALKKLKEKDIVKIEKHNKQNKIKLNKHFIFK